MRRGPICKWQLAPPFICAPCGAQRYSVLASVSASYPELTGRLPTCYSPIRRSFHRRPPEGFSLLPALDLHVLGTPPAFVLSQDQTLHKNIRKRIVRSNVRLKSQDRKSTRLNSSHVKISYAVF